jgi:AcrR family transcriptional regulator
VVAPRTYNQDRRAESSAATQHRIRVAARALYRERGISGTTTAAIAEHADVARGTILHHFGSADGLLEAVLDDITTELEWPDEHVQDGVEPEAERIRRYVDAMFRFFVRSEEDWPAFARDLDHPSLQKRAAEYFETAERFFAATFGDLATDRVVAAAARAYVNYGPLNDLRTAGLNLEESIELVGSSLTELARERRALAREPAHQQGRKV